MNFPNRRKTGDARILHIGKYYPPVRGGMESFLESLATALARSGTENAVVVHEFSIKRLDQHSGNRTPEAPDRNPTVYRVPILGKCLHTPICPAFPFWLRKICRRFHPDVIHVQMPNVSGLWAIMLASTRTRPLVIHWQADVDDPGNGRSLSLLYLLYRPFEQSLLRRANRVIVSSHAYLDGSRALERWKFKCKVIPLGIDPGHLTTPSATDRQRAREMWGSSEYRILAIGRLTFYKGMDQLILAANNLPEVQVVIVGSGKERRKLEKLINSLQLQNRVILAGECTDGLRSALLESCTCFCLPSVSRAESFGIVSLEAMAFAKPVIASKVPRSGVSWVVEDGVTGFHVDVSSPSAISDAVKRLLNNPVLARRMGDAGYQRLHRLFTIQAVVSQILAVYSELDETPAIAQ